MLKQLKPVNAFTFQSNEKYLNLKPKIKKNIQRKQRRIDLGGKKKKRKKTIF